MQRDAGACGLAADGCDAASATPASSAGPVSSFHGDDVDDVQDAADADATVPTQTQAVHGEERICTVTPGGGSEAPVKRPRVDPVLKEALWSVEAKPLGPRSAATAAKQKTKELATPQRSGGPPRGRRSAGRPPPHSRCGKCPPCLNALSGKKACVRGQVERHDGAWLSVRGEKAIGILIGFSEGRDPTGQFRISRQAKIIGFDPCTWKHKIGYITGEESWLALYNNDRVRIPKPGNGSGPAQLESEAQGAASDGEPASEDMDVDVSLSSSDEEEMAHAEAAAPPGDIDPVQEQGALALLSEVSGPLSELEMLRRRLAAEQRKCDALAAQTKDANTASATAAAAAFAAAEKAQRKRTAADAAAVAKATAATASDAASAKLSAAEAACAAQDDVVKQLRAHIRRVEEKEMKQQQAQEAAAKKAKLLREMEEKLREMDENKAHQEQVDREIQRLNEELEREQAECQLAAPPLQLHWRALTPDDTAPMDGPA